jgi:enoyl-CoA hydratase
MSTYDHIAIDRKGSSGIILLNRPEAMNALESGMLLQLESALGELEKDEPVRVIIITGGKNFCAGADIREMRDMNPQEAGEFAALGHRVFDRIENCAKPVIAAIAGYALGGGCELALACDIRIAGESARLGQPEVKLGLVPGFSGAQRLARLVGTSRSKELVLTGKIVDSNEAEFIGLINRVVPDPELMKKAEETALLIAQASPHAVKLAKELANRYSAMTGELSSMDIEAFVKCYESAEHIEGMNAFLEKRKAKF